MNAPNDTARREAIAMKLYVAGNNPYSLRARANLDSLLAQLDHETVVDIVDVMRAPEVALTEGILATPALVVRIGDTSLLFIGDLSQREEVLDALRRHTGEAA
ncbi:MAG: circadian clock protein KaiB [Azoarcus sp.]|nr:circadian clock protein KaiB [Azoarcus sp.]